MAKRGAFFGLALVGADHLMKALEILPRVSMRESVLRRGLKRAAKPTVAHAKAGVAKDQGDLAESITVRNLKRRHKGEAALAIGPAGLKGKAGPLIELGTVDRIVKSTRRAVGRVTAQPFLRPAYDATKKQLMLDFAVFVSEELKKAARRLAKKAEKGTMGKGTRKALLR